MTSMRGAAAVEFNLHRELLLLLFPVQPQRSPRGGRVSKRRGIPRESNNELISIIGICYPELERDSGGLSRIFQY